jgi:hypothetical protein
MREALVIAMLSLLWGPMVVACSQDGARPSDLSSFHERMIQDMARTGAGSGGAGGGGGGGPGGM